MPPNAFGFNGPGVRSAADVLNEEDDSTFSNVLRFLGRPGFATRSLLSGDFEGAAKNLGQLVLDFPTGGFIDRDLSLANLFTDSGDLTTQKERPEFSDLLHRYGGTNPKALGFGSRLALDVIGGALTDPLTLLGGTGAARSVSAGALKGAGRFGATLKIGRALRNTPAGAKALAEASDDIGRAVLGGFNQKLRIAEGAGNLKAVRAIKDNPVFKALSAAKPTAPFTSPALRGLDSRAVERVFFKALGSGDLGTATRAGRLAEKFTMSPGLSEGIQALEKQALIPTSSALHWRIPFTETYGKIPGTENFWSKVGKWGTAPGWVRQGLHKFDKTKPLAEIVDTSAIQLKDWVQTSFYDRAAKSMRGLIPAGLQDSFRSASSEMWGERRRLDSFIQRYSSQFTEEQARIMGRVWQRVEDVASIPRKALSFGTGRRYTVEASGLPLPRGMQEIFVPDSPMAVRFWRGESIEGADDLVEELVALSKAPSPARRARVLVRQGLSKDEVVDWFKTRSRLSDKEIDEALKGLRGVSPTVKSLREQLLRDLNTELPGNPAALEQIVDGVMAEHQKMVDDLVRLGVWAKKDANPFYLSRQASPLFHEVAGQALKDKNVRTALKDVFTKARQTDTRFDFQAALKKIADDHGIDIEGLISEVQETDLFKLFRDRAFAHTQTVARATVTNKAQKLIKAGAAEQPLNAYIKFQFEPLGMRESFLSKVLGGGKFRVPADRSGHRSLKEWAEKYNQDPASKFFKREIVTDSETGKAFVEIAWPGLNHFVKPALTVINPKFHVRNAVSTMFMATFDPDMAVGVRGHVDNLKNVWDSLHDAFVVRLFGKSGYAGDEMADVLRFLGDDPAASEVALQRLVASGKTIGPYSWDEAAKVLRGALGPGVETGGADLMTRLSEADVLGREILNNGPKAKVAFNRIIQLGRDMAQITETRTRAKHILALLSKGVEPEEALKRVGDAFVDYSINSTTERFLRDIIPFAKFTMGSTKWIKPLAERPALINWMGRVSGTSEDEFLPERAEDSLALPLPWLDGEGNRQFLTGLGLPQETVLNVMGVVTPRGFRRQILGSLQPQVKLPLEAITDRNFYFGDDFGKFRKAPNWMPEAFTTKVELPDGSVRHEISGNVNEILNAMPTAALDGALNRWLDSRRSKVNKLINNLTGVRTMSVDTERELKLRLHDYLKDKARSGQVGEALVYFERLDPESMPEDLRIILSTLKGLKKRKKKRGVRSGFGF